jgi:ABC-2 type transport system permease protein
MKKYLAFIKCSFLVGMVWRLNYLFTLISNLFYIVILYFLWKSIFNNSRVLNGMTFNQVFVYLTVASSIFVLFKSWLEWFISGDIISGRITVGLIKPIDYQKMMMAFAAGHTLNSALLVTIPSMIVVFGIFQMSVPFGWNILFFCLSLPFAWLLSTLIDYSIGITSFYTESLWGISTGKEIMVLLLSGALIPLHFFPQQIKNVLLYLPFQAIYHTPASILTGAVKPISEYVSMLGVQMVWIVVLCIASRLFFAQAIKVLTVNGG